MEEIPLSVVEFSQLFRLAGMGAAMPTNVAHVAQLGGRFQSELARMQRTIRHLGFETLNLRTRRSGVRVPPGAPFLLPCILFTLSETNPAGGATRATRLI
jgi:hypothetical protein